MSQTGPWSVKGIDQRARDAARDAAMAEGLTLGEYLNRLLMANEAPAPREVAEPFQTSTPRPDAASSTLDRLTRRIEATEARSTLAITGMDHTVLGLVARLENAEQNSAAIAGHVEGLIDELRSTHESLQSKVRRLEQDDSAKQNLEALKSLESALGKLASHVYEENELAQGESQAIKGRVEAGFAEMGERVEKMETKVERTLSEAAQRVEKAVSQAELRAEGAARHLSDRMSQIEAQVNDRLGENEQLAQRMNAVETDVSGALTSMEGTLLRIQDRLNRAETTTDKALQHLESTFDHLDKRINAVARTVDPELASRLRQEFEARFEDLTRQVRETVSNSRLELADEIARAASNGPAIEDVVSLRGELQSIKRQMADVATKPGLSLDEVRSAIEVRVSELNGDINQRVAMLSDDFEMRLSNAAMGGGEADSGIVRAELEKLSTQVTERLDTIAGQIDQRVSESEMRQAHAIEQVGEQVSIAANRLQKRQDESMKTLAVQIDENRKRADARLSDALASVSDRLELMHSQTAATLSPVQKAIVSLATRLESLEEFVTPPFADRVTGPQIPSIPALPENAPLFETESASSSSADDIWSPLPALPEAASSRQDLSGAGDKPYADDYAAMAPAAASSTQAAKTYVAELPPSDGIDPFSDLLSDLDRDDAHTEARESDVFDTFAEAPTPEERPSARGQSTAQAASADYISRARQAAIAASIDGRTNVRRKTPSARKASVRPRPAGSKTKSKAPLYAAGAAVVMAGTAAAAYVYLRGKQEAPEFATSQPVFSIPEAGMARAAPETEAPATELTAEETAALEAALFEAGDDAANSSLAPVPAPAIEGLSVATTAVAKAAAEPVEKAATQAAVSQPAVKTATTPVDASPASQDAPYAPILPVVTVEAAANGGNQFAQYQFAEDRLAAGDFTTGAAMMKKAAQKGLPSAEYRLAKLHERGMGVPKDLTLARQWTEKAAKGGNVKAMYDLAVFMAQGEGGAQSYSGAAEWFRKGAEYGLVDSQYNLGLLYEQGLGISPSLSDALFWYEVAAAKGDKDAIAKAKDLRSRLSAESQAQVTARATSWTPSRDVAVANGRFGAQPWNTGNPLQVQGVQNALNALGFKAGAADGVLTPMTAKAIRDYQGANKLDVTGTVTGALVDSLNARLTTATPKN